jgi:NAD(P)-dependent dehydrogenase (short-subunit alcohol dehydrogenase family)
VLNGRVALVTGGAGGIGSATSRALAARGASVVVADIDEDAARAVADAITAAGGIAVGMACDIGSPDSVAALIERISAEVGGIDVLHNNAAATALARHDDRDVLATSVEVWDETMRVNLRGTMLLTQAVLPHMLECGRGSIVNMTSTSGLQGGLAQTAYGVSKAAIIALTQATATQYGSRGVRCNAIAPGLIVTSGNAGGHSGGFLGALMARHHLTPRLGVPDDIAETVCWLASDAAAFVTGTVIRVDGGFTAHSPAVADIAALTSGAPKTDS